MSRTTTEMPTLDCPPPEQLAEFSVGRLPNDVLDAIAGHLEVCERCGSSLHAVDAVSDALATELRNPAASEPFSDLQCQQVVEKVEALGSHAISFLRGAAANERADDVSPAITDIGHYRLLEELGRGSMGTVYKAWHRQLDKAVALKVLSATWLVDQHVVARFRREMKAVGQLDHPHIVRAIDAGEGEGMLYLVMEFVEGSNLYQLSKHAGPLPIADAAELVRQTALGLQYSHEHKLVHRDIKPSNLMLTAAGIVKILDLGLSLLLGGPTVEEKLTTSDQIMGTADYMSPEQVSNPHAVDIRADIYSLGCTLFKLLTGRPPFSGARFATPLVKLCAHQQTPAPAVSQWRADVPDALQCLLDKMLAKDPTDRFQEPAELAAALEPFTAGNDLIGLLQRARGW